MIKVEFNKKNENPFYGCSNCLRLIEQAAGTVTYSMLDAAWKEVAQDLEKRKMFFSVLFPHFCQLSFKTSNLTTHTI